MEDPAMPAAARGSRSERSVADGYNPSKPASFLRIISAAQVVFLDGAGINCPALDQVPAEQLDAVATAAILATRR